MIYIHLWGKIRERGREQEEVADGRGSTEKGKQKGEQNS